MKIKRIAHLGIAVKDLDAPKKFYAENLGLKLKGDEVVETQKVKVSFIQVGESNLELLLPTSADSAVAKFLENKGEGFHHLALEGIPVLKGAGRRGFIDGDGAALEQRILICHAPLYA